MTTERCLTSCTLQIFELLLTLLEGDYYGTTMSLILCLKTDIRIEATRAEKSHKQLKRKERRIDSHSRQDA